MRIISNFHDYYDSLQDPTDSTLYFRKTEIINISDFDQFGDKNNWKYKLNDLIRNGLSAQYNFRLLGFCGKIYRLFSEVYSIKVDPITYIPKPNNPDILIDLSEEEFSKQKNESRYQYFWKTDYKKYKTIDLSFLEKEDLHQKYNTPVFLIRGTELIINPNLKQIGFNSFMPIQQVYQEIDMYIGGVLKQPEKQIDNISEKNRMASRFGHKYSFRKLPEKK